MVKSQRGTRWWERLQRLAAQLAGPLRALQWAGLRSSSPQCSDGPPLVATGRVFMDDGESVQVTSLMGSSMRHQSMACHCVHPSTGFEFLGPRHCRTTTSGICGIDAPHQLPLPTGTDVECGSRRRGTQLSL